MAWVSTRNGSNLHWSYTALYGGLTRTSVAPTQSATLLTYNGVSRKFSPEKTYLFRTKVDNFDYSNSYKRLEIRAFGFSFSYQYNATQNISTLPLSSLNDTYLNWYIRPQSLNTTTVYAAYHANYNEFGTQSGPTGVTASVIQELTVTEFDWLLQGWTMATSSNSLENSKYEGWRFNESNESFQFNHRQKNDSNRRRPADGFTSSNYISKFIDYDEFNLELYFDNISSSSLGFIDIYMTNSLLPNNNTSFTQSLAAGQKIATFTSSGTYSFYKLTGNRYLNFVANYSNGNTTYQVGLRNISIQGGYQLTDNNEQFLFTNTDQYYEPTPLSIIGGSSDATYSIITTTRQTRHNPTASVFFGATGSPGFFSNIYGSVVNLSQQTSKIGNGTFKSGIWENGVWNSGWRVDNQVYELLDIVTAFNITTQNSNWRIQISGPTQSIDKFEIGDNVAISNIVAIDINEKRKLIKNYFRIVNKDDSNIIVEVGNNFPIRRIEKDSEFHKIRITKNVWLNGGFLNGYFEGIWNDGLYKGYPFLTEMYNTHWIDGIFDGGYFNSFYPEYNFNDTLWTDGNVGLSFSSPHGFLLGDLVIIDKSDKTFNSSYDGTASIIEIIDDYYVVTDIPWGSNSTLESGVVRRYTATGLIQNFTFYDNNVSSKTSRQTETLKDIWRFNSWLDINFSTHSSTNINRPRTYFNNKPSGSFTFGGGDYGIGEFGALNLYGFITKDVLSSDSSFRDIDSFNKRKYSLGTKYEIYEDFLGEISEFNEVFGSNGLNGGDSNFFNNGWTYSFSGTYSGTFSIPVAFTFSRTVNGTLLFEFATASNQFITLENTNVTIEKNRYSIIEFDLLRQESTWFNASGLSPISLYNFTNFLNDEGDSWSSTPAFPISNNVNYYQIPNERKTEYFFNRPGLDIGLLSIGNLTVKTFPGSIIELDNIKFYEVDAIPFFQYTTEDYVNISVQVPYQGIAPFIDYENADFSFTDNISIGFDSIEINSSGVPITSAASTPLIYSNATLQER